MGKNEPRNILRARALNNIPHGFLTGIGHTGMPDPAIITDDAQLILLKQVHSSVAIVVDSPLDATRRPEADAMATATPGLVLGIVTADCAPVLFADHEAGVVGAAHAGWRGAHGGVLEATVTAMEQLGARRNHIVAAIGPTIALENYEVDTDFAQQFEDRDSRFFAPGTAGKYQFDLPAYVSWRLKDIGLAIVEDLELDTYADENRFYSYRRATHRGEPSEGRQFSLISLTS